MTFSIRPPVPEKLIVATCAHRPPGLFELTLWTRMSIEGKSMYQLSLESIELINHPLTKGVVAGRVKTINFNPRIPLSVPPQNGNINHDPSPYTTPDKHETF